MKVFLANDLYTADGRTYRKTEIGQRFTELPDHLADKLPKSAKVLEGPAEPKLIPDEPEVVDSDFDADPPLDDKLTHDHARAEGDAITKANETAEETARREKAAAFKAQIAAEEAAKDKKGKRGK